MTSMTDTIIPKSDQLNADDLIAGRTITIKITGVKIVMGDQPVALSYEGDNGKPYKPGKSMRRVLVSVWGADANLYVGRSLTLYRDDKVTFGGSQVGGIRISHMSHLNEPKTMALTATKAVRKPFTVKPLAANPVDAKNATTQPAQAASPITEPLTPEEIEIAQAEARKGTEALGIWWKGLLAIKGAQKHYVTQIDELKRIAAEADANILTDEILL